MARTLYWNPAAAANFNSATSWALTPTGTPNESTPTAIDTCYFTNSNSQTCTINAGSTCLDLDATSGTGFTGTITGTGALSVAGNLKWNAGQTTTYTGTITFTSTSTGKTITHNGKGSASSYTFNGVGGGWQFVDDPTAASTKNYTITNGSVDFNGRTIVIENFDGSNSNTRTVTLGAANITIYGLWTFTTTTNLTFSGASSTILSNTGATFAGGGLTYGSVTWDGTSITGSNTFTSLTLTGAAVSLTGSNTITTFAGSGTAAQTFTVTDGTTQTITNIPSGTATYYTTWTGSSTAGWTLSTPTITKLSYVDISYCTKAGTGKIILDSTCCSTTGWSTNTGFLSISNTSNNSSQEPIPAFFQDIGFDRDWGFATPEWVAGSDSTGSQFYIGSQSGTFCRFARDKKTGQYIQTHYIDPTLAVPSGDTASIVVIGSYVYLFTNDNTNVVCSRFLAADLTGEQVMTVPTVACTGTCLAWTDGTNAYVVTNSATTTVNKWTLSGTTFSADSTATIATLGAYTTAMWDGSYAYQITNSVTTPAIKKLETPLGTPQTITTRTYPILSDNELGNIIINIDKNRCYIGKMYAIYDEAAQIGARLALFPIVKPT